MMMVVNHQKPFLLLLDGSMYVKIVIDIPGPCQSPGRQWPYLSNVIGLRYRRGNGFLDLGFVHYYIVLATR